MRGLIHIEITKQQTGTESFPEHRIQLLVEEGIERILNKFLILLTGPVRTACPDNPRFRMNITGFFQLI